MFQRVQGQMKVKLLEGQGHAHCHLWELGILTFTDLELQGQTSCTVWAKNGCCNVERLVKNEF